MAGTIQGIFKLGGVKVNGLVDAGHDAVLHQALDDLAGGFLHPGGQLAHGDLVGNLHGERRLPGHLHLQAAHFLLLLVAALVALEFAGLLLVGLLALAAADALLAALVVLHPLGYQVIHICEPVGIEPTATVKVMILKTLFNPRLLSPILKGFFCTILSG